MSELDIGKIDSLLDVASKQLLNVVNDCLRHANATLGVEWDHPSMSVVKEELRKRVDEVLDEHFTG